MNEAKFHSLFWLMLTLVAAPARAAPPEDSSHDPRWDGYRNRLLPDPLPLTRQDFGLNRFQDQRAVGGWVQRSRTPAWFAKVIPARTLDHKLSASGKFAVTNDAGNSGLLFGWF